MFEGVIGRVVRRSVWSRRQFLPGGAASLAADSSGVVKAALLVMDLSITLYPDNLDAERLRLETRQNDAFLQLSTALRAIGQGDLTIKVDAELSSG